METEGAIFDRRGFVFVLGAQKSGTTWLSELLGRHSEIHVPRAKELHYFTRNYHKGDAWYRAQFGDSGRRYLCEATPNYLAANYPEYRETPRRIARAIPGAKFIVLLRDPVERAISAYMHHVVRGRFRYRHSIDEHFHELVRSPVSTAGIIEFGFYFQQLQIYFEHFSPDRFLILTFEHDLVGNPAGTLARIMKFLDLENEALDLGMPKRNVGIRSAASARLGALLSRLLKDDQTRMNLGGIIQRFCVLVETALGFDGLKLGQGVRGMLGNCYRDSNDRLAQLTGIDTSIWNRHAEPAGRSQAGEIHRTAGLFSTQDTA